MQWCSDSASPDWKPTPPDPFGAGTDSDCPLAPASWALDKVVAACEKLCAPVDACLGFTLYPAARNGGPVGRNLTECCLRTTATVPGARCSVTAKLVSSGGAALSIANGSWAIDLSRCFWRGD